jgi:hypothetical protein
MKMDDGELHIGADLAAELVAGQFPERASLPISPVEPAGMVNMIFRVGCQYYVRLPRLRNGPGPGTGVSLAARLAPSDAAGTRAGCQGPAGEGFVRGVSAGHQFAGRFRVTNWTR